MMTEVDIERIVDIRVKAATESLDQRRRVLKNQRRFIDRKIIRVNKEKRVLGNEINKLHKTLQDRKDLFKNLKRRLENALVIATNAQRKIEKYERAIAQNMGTETLAKVKFYVSKL